MSSILRKRSLLLHFLAMLVCHTAAFAQSIPQMVKLIENDRQHPSSSLRNVNDYFGYSVAISGEYAVVGAYQKEEAGLAGITNAGAAYIYHLEKGVWKMQQKIVASDKAANDFFGFSVSISGDYIIVGAYQNDADAGGMNPIADAGAAYIFKRAGSAWNQQQKLVATDRASSDQFGKSVAISGDYLVVSAPQNDIDSSNPDAGAAYVFFRNGTTWMQQQKMVADDRAANDYFGYSVAISGDNIIAGAYAEDHNASGTASLSNAGSAYVFTRMGSGWTQQQKIVASDRAASDFFGTSVAIDGAYIVVGAASKRIDAINPAGGAAYVFFRSGTTWMQQQKILPSDRAANDFFGRAVAINGDYIVVGAYMEDEDAAANVNSTLINAGSAYLFIRSGNSWAQQQKIIASDREANDNFGFAVAINDTNVFAGAYLEDDDGFSKVSNAGAVYAFSRQAATWKQLQKIIATEQAADDHFGYAVGVSGNYAVVGAYGEDEDANGTNTLVNAGAAYIFRNTGGSWVFEQKIVASDRSSDDFFGASVAISGDYIIVGAYGEDEDAGGGNTASASGSAYIFHRIDSTWTQQQKITAVDREANDYFGYAVSINGDYAVVGAYQEDHDGSGSGAPANNSGSAYVFNRNGSTWSQQQKLLASDRSANDWFGYAVAIDGSSIIVGAHQEDEDVAGNNYLASAGAAYLFTRVGTVWTQQQKMVAADRVTGEAFGYSVSLSNDYAVVGAHGDSRSGNGNNGLANAGAAYVFFRSAGVWMEQQRIVASDRTFNDHFGHSVAISGDYLVVGAYQEDEDSSNSNTISDAGSAYVFRRSTGNWIEEKKLVASDRSASDNFGYAVAINGTYILTGAPNNDEDANGGNPLSNAGGAYLFMIPPSPLPINLLSFSAGLLDGKRCRLSWTMSAADAGTAYEINRCGDGRSFGTIASVAGTGENGSYTVYDEQPLTGINYYRLKITGAGSSVYYSNVAVVSHGPAEGPVMIAPLPATNVIVISNVGSLLMGRVATVTNIQGREIYRFLMDATSTLPTSNWPAGVYVLHLPNGENIKIPKQ